MKGITKRIFSEAGPMVMIIKLKKSPMKNTAEQGRRLKMHTEDPERSTEDTEQDRNKNEKNSRMESGNS